MSDWPQEPLQRDKKAKVRIVRPWIEGLKMTFRHLGRKRVTLQYPEEKRTMYPRWRGRHHLLKDPKTGLERCVACGLCASICPPEAISIQAGEREDHSKYPVKFEVDLGRCIFCGFCVEACPKKAIAMGPEYELAVTTRGQMILDKEELLNT